MSGTRIWIIVCAAAVVAVLAGGWFLVAQPEFAAASAADSSAASAESTNQGLQVKLASLSKLGAKQSAMKAQESTLEKAVPSVLKPNTFIRRVNEVAATTGVTVKDVAINQSAAYTVPQSLIAATPASTATSGTTDAASPSPSATESAASAAPAPAATASAPKLVLTDPLVTASNFVDVPVTLTVSGTQDAILAFSTAMQQDERTFLINSVAIAASDDGGQSGVLSGYIYTVKR